MYKHIYETFKHWYNNDRGSIYLYSDPHFNDPEMPYIRKNYIGDKEQINNINKTIGKYDTIIFLGDIGDAKFIKKIKGYKVLIKGNHDSGNFNYLRQITNRNIEIKCSEIKFLSFDEYCKNFPFDEYCKNHPSENISNVIKKYTIYIKNILYAYCIQTNKIRSEENIIKVNYSDDNKNFCLTICYDNHMFDEVYEGPLFISEKILLSHEPLDFNFALNIHGHTHSNKVEDDTHIDICAEHINYTPIKLKDIIESGKLKKVYTTHRSTIDTATKRKQSRKVNK